MTDDRIGTQALRLLRRNFSVHAAQDLNFVLKEELSAHIRIRLQRL
jgi:hypothetical protein